MDMITVPLTAPEEYGDTTNRTDEPALTVVETLEAFTPCFTSSLQAS
jgi:hypothetical protein